LINRRALETEGYEVKTAFTLNEARFQLEDAAPDVILLDVKMPDGNGFEFCREIRERVAAHIIFLTSVTETEGELEGLASGGDDYLRKPYGIELLRARVKRVLQKEKDPQIVKRGPLALHIASAKGFINGEDLRLTQKEFAALLLLAQNEGKILSPEYIYEKAWGQPMSGDRSAIQTAISRLRGKIEPAGRAIVFYRGKGYAFETV
jgi:DNA-binding response OmpR family regulator